MLSTLASIRCPSTCRVRLGVAFGLKSLEADPRPLPGSVNTLSLIRRVEVAGSALSLSPSRSWFSSVTLSMPGIMMSRRKRSYISPESAASLYDWRADESSNAS